MENKGRWLILDGLHRLMKASVLGMKKSEGREGAESVYTEGR